MGPEKDSKKTAEITLAVLTGGDRQRFAISAWASVAAALLTIGELACIASAIAEMLHTKTAVAGLPFVAAFAVIALLRIALDGYSTALAARAAEAVKLRARRQLAHAIAGICPIDRNKPHAGEAANLLTGHVDALGAYLTRYRPARLRASVVPIAVLLITAWFSWVAALVLLITGPLIPIFMALIGAEARTASERQLQEIGNMNAGLLDKLQGITTLKLFDALPRATDSLLRDGENIRMRTMAVLRIAFLSSAVLELFAALGVAFAAVYVGFTLLGHIGFGAYGEMTLFGGLFVLMIAPEYFRPLRDFATAYHDQAAALAASSEIENLVGENHLRLPERKTLAGRLLSIEIYQASVVLGDTTVLAPFSLHIEAGEHIALTGPSGSGKSMVLALLGGLVDPASGHVLVNGRSDLSPAIAWLGQRPAFVQASIAANLTMYRPDAGRQGFAEAARLARADEVIAKLGRGYDELLRENGANLSGGEGQRLAIARLALSSAGLILADEPTEHLDAETAKAVIDGLIEVSRGRTLIVATHDPRLASRVDRVIDVRELGKRPILEAAE